MSARATTWVWQHSQARGIDRLVMLAIADESSDNGRFSSSVATVARKAGIDVRTVQRALQRLQGMGELSAAVNGERGPRGTYVYRVLFSDRPQMAAITPGAESPPAQSHPRQAATAKLGQSPPAQSHPPAERRTSSTKNKEQKTATQSSAKTRQIDDLFEAMTVVCGINRSELTDAQRGSLNGALRQLRAVNATGTEIHARAARYRAQMPQARLTPPALAKHWPTLGEQPLGLAVGATRGGARIPLGNGRYIGSDGIERAMPPSGRFAAE